MKSTDYKSGWITTAWIEIQSNTSYSAYSEFKDNSSGLKLEKVALFVSRQNFKHRGNETDELLVYNRETTPEEYMSVWSEYDNKPDSNSVMIGQIQPHELCAYLPYKAEVKTPYGQSRVVSFCTETETVNIGQEEEFRLADVKLLLRPLSDLIKGIEHNGEKFVPLAFLAEINFGGNYIFPERVFEGDHVYRHYFVGRGDTGGCEPEYTYGSVCLEYNNYYNSFIVSEEGDSMTHCHDLNQLKLIQQLHEWHFDTFNLIGRGLAERKIEQCFDSSEARNNSR